MEAPSRRRREIALRSACSGRDIARPVAPRTGGFKGGPEDEALSRRLRSAGV